MTTPVEAVTEGWKTPPDPMHHPCSIPSMSFGDAGRIWECPECKCEWTLNRRPGIEHRVLSGVLSAPDVDAAVAMGGLDFDAQLRQALAEAPDMPDFDPPAAVVEDSPVEDGHSTSCALVLKTGMCSCGKAARDFNG